MLTLSSWFMRSRTRQANSYFEPPRPDARCHQVPTQDITQRSYQLLAGRSMTFHRSYRIQPSYLNLSPHMHVNFLSLHPSNRMQRTFGPSLWPHCDAVVLRRRPHLYTTPKKQTGAKEPRSEAIVGRCATENALNSSVPFPQNSQCGDHSAVA